MLVPAVVAKERVGKARDDAERQRRYTDVANPAALAGECTGGVVKVIEEAEGRWQVRRERRRVAVRNSTSHP